MIQLPTHPAPLNWLVLCTPNLAHWAVQKCKQISNAGSAGAYVKFILMAGLLWEVRGIFRSLRQSFSIPATAPGNQGIVVRQQAMNPLYRGRGV
jgi:hypothetical protein